nr:diguanylate cyclase [Luteibacter rhizovicinus]
MLAAPLPDDEVRRLERLRGLAVLDTAPEPFFDGIVRVASLVTGSPIALVSLIDHDRQWFKAQFGLDGTTETPRDISFCAHAIHGSTLFEVRDTRKDHRFADNPLVEADPNIRFYAGMPIAMEGGSGMGTLCVIDHVPRELTPTQRDILATLAGLVGMALEQRATAVERNAALAREVTLERDLRRTAQEWEMHRRRAVTSLEASERRFRQLFHYSLGLICTHDLDGVLLSVNPAAAKSLGYPINSLMGRSLAEFMRPEMVPAFNAYLRRIIDEGSDSGRLELRAANGELRIWAYHNVLDEDDEERYVLGHAQDITEQHRQERQLREWSLSDPLTHCFNRRYLGQLGDMTRDETLGCITVDLDHFKAVNDTYGHQRGDDVLVDMATFLRARVRDEDAVVRLGGDEFLVVLRSADDRQLAEVSARLRDDAQSAPIGFTLGAAMKLAGTPLDAALSRADQRLYEARASRSAII